MTQIPSGDWPINPATTSGSTLASKLNSVISAVMSGMLGAGRPAGATKGLIYTKTNGTAIEQVLFDGTADRVLSSVDAAGVARPTNVYLQSEVDAMIAALQLQIGSAGGVPSGLIALWKGATSAIPAGWVICDGNNGTPDLRDKFVVGAGSAYAVAAVGGKAEVTEVLNHTHPLAATTTITGASAGTPSGKVNLTNLSLSASAEGPGTSGGRVARGTIQGAGATVAALASAVLAFVGDRLGNHGHAASTTGTATNPAGGVTSIDNRPPYYALAYIMKV